MSTDPEVQTKNMIKNLEEMTGRSLSDWVKLTRDGGFEKHREIINFLKSDHGLTYGYANLIALEARKSGDQSPLDAQYSGPKSALRPIYDALSKEVLEFGSDVKVQAKKTYVSLRRNKQFGLIQPSTRTRVDVGINLMGVSPTDRLEASGSFNSMVSHRVRLEHVDEVDKELIGWLRQAYTDA
jgi:predicted transport protein